MKRLIRRDDLATHIAEDFRVEVTESNGLYTIEIFTNPYHLILTVPFHVTEAQASAIWGKYPSLFKRISD